MTEQAHPLSLVSFDDFSRLQLRAARIEAVHDHPKADKLYLLELSLGEDEKRTIVAGIKPYRTPAELLGKTIVIVANLEPAVIRGVESQGMLLAAGGRGGDAFGLLVPDNPDVTPGTAVS